ncbi:MAG: phage portal protein [Planctomycetota bacterium]|jgi:PBSX family phage portal protein
MAIVKAEILGEDGNQLDAAGRSKQIPADVWDYDKTGAKEPPYNLDALAHFLEINTWHFRSCKTKAIVTAGLGYDFIVPEGVENADPRHKATLQKFFSYPNEEQTWGEILENVLTDFEALGNGYFEVVRNRFGKGPPRAIYHVPAVTMRVRKDKKGFVQRRGRRTVYFRPFGTTPDSPVAFDPRDKGKPPGRRRLLHEAIHLKNYHPRSSYYGLPDFLPALRALVGNKMAGDFNIQFFENNAVPQCVITVSGGEFAKGTRKRIEEYFRQHIKGQAHKTLIIEAPAEEGQKVDVDIQPLSVEIRDSSFRMFRADNAEEIRVAHGVPGRLIGLTEKGGLGGAGEGTSQQEIFKYHVIEPKQTRLEYRINNFLIKRGFGIHDWELRFKEIDVTDEAKVAEIVNKLVRLGVVTINEARRAMSHKPLKHPGADTPFINTSSGPLSLDILAEGGVRPLNMPPRAGEGKGLLKAEAADPGVSVAKILRGQFDTFESQGLRGELDAIMAYAERAFGPEVAEKLRPYTERYLRRAFRAGQGVDGHTFSTASAMSLVEKALDGPPEAIEGLSPWPSEDRERDDFYIKTSKGREYLRGKSESWLQSRGMGTPPLHAGCRCVVIPEVA